MDYRVDLMDECFRIVFHIAGNPIQHHADESVSEKARHEPLVLLTHLQSFGLLVHHGTQQAIGDVV